MVTIPVRCPHCQSTEVSRRASKPTAPNAISVKTGSARGGSFSSSTGIGAEYLKSAARSSIWPSMAAGSATPPACYALAPQR
jgi:hypothetical protein